MRSFVTLVRQSFYRLGSIFLIGGVAFAMMQTPARAETTAGLSSFPGPSISAHPMAVIKAKNLDKGNGWNLSWEIRTSFVPWINDFFNGTYQGLHFSGINYLITNYHKGVPIRIVGASSSYPWPLMVRADAGINSIQDLKGKKVGVPKASYIWAYLRFVFLKAGIDVEKDLKIQNANIIQAVQLLERGDFDATLPLLSQAIQLEKKAPGKFKVLLFPDSEVAKLLGRERMYQVVTMRADWLEGNAGGAAKVLKTLADMQEFVVNNVDESVKIMGPKTVVTGGKGSGGANLPDYVITTMYRDGYHGRKMQWFGIPASELKREIKSELELYLDAGMIKKIPDDKFFWTE